MPPADDYAAEECVALAFHLGCLFFVWRRVFVTRDVVAGFLLVQYDVLKPSDGESYVL